MPLRTLAIVLALGLLTAACGDDGDPQLPADGVALLDHAKWVETKHDDDPFWAARPTPDPACAPYSFQIEGFSPETQSIEIDTTACDYLTIGLEIPAAIKRGDTLELVAWHLRLSADGATEQNPVPGMMAVAVGSNVIWQKSFDIPSAEASYVEKLSADFDAPAGTLLTFHVHNHGNNNYNLMKVDIVADKP
ncbi:MAG: hypothetical protein KC503_09110 [Myxococcales bacterium]|nr:hypothetical protein [Myxococcales bacterium]